jgi:hypothetical protein
VLRNWLVRRLACANIRMDAERKALEGIVSKPEPAPQALEPTPEENTKPQPIQYPHSGGPRPARNVAGRFFFCYGKQEALMFVSFSASLPPVRIMAGPPASINKTVPAFLLRNQIGRIYRNSLRTNPPNSSNS